MSAVNEVTLPRSLVERFEQSSAEGNALVAMLGVLRPRRTKYRFTNPPMVNAVVSIDVGFVLKTKTRSARP